MRGYSMGGRNCGCTTPAKSCNETTHQTVTLSRLARTSAAVARTSTITTLLRFLGWKSHGQHAVSLLDPRHTPKMWLLNLCHLFTRPSDPSPSGINLTLDNAKGSEGWKLIALRAFRPLRCLPSWSWSARHLEEHAANPVIWWLLACSFWAPIWGGDFSLLFHSHSLFETPMPSAMGDGLWSSAFRRRSFVLGIFHLVKNVLPHSGKLSTSPICGLGCTNRHQKEAQKVPHAGLLPHQENSALECPKATGDQNCCTALTVAWAESRADNATLLTVLTKIPKSLISFLVVPFPAGGHPRSSLHQDQPKLQTQKDSIGNFGHASRKRSSCSLAPPTSL